MQATLQRVRRGIKAAELTALLATATGLAMISLSQAMPVWRLAVAAGAVAVSRLALWPLRSLERQLTYTGYCHADR